MRTVNIHEAKTQLSRLVADVVAGESIVIARSGKPAAKLVPLGGGEAVTRRVGFLEGLAEIPDDFDTMAADEITASFAGLA